MGGLIRHFLFLGIFFGLGFLCYDYLYGNSRFLSHLGYSPYGSTMSSSISTADQGTMARGLSEAKYNLERHRSELEKTQADVQ